MTETERQTVIETMLYFSAQKRLATVEELYRYQVGGRIPRERMASTVATIPEIRSERGLFGFADEFEQLRVLRQEKQRETVRRLRKIRRYGRFLISVPYVRAIFVAGSLSFSTGNAKQSSDIDIFVVMKPDRIWLGRLYLTLVTQVLGIRRRGEYDENLFCLNHYVTSNNLARTDHDIYSAELYSDYIAIGSESQKVLKQFWTQNSWTKTWFPKNSWRLYEGVSDLSPYWWSRGFENLVEALGGGLCNALVGWIQRKKIQRNHLTREPYSRIQADDTELEFHPQPNSNQVQERIQHRRLELGV